MAVLQPIPRIIGISMSGPTFSGQIAFPATQNASADPNTLDDYEEGTFNTVGLSFGGGTTGITYTLQAGTYVKIGKRVFGEARIVLSAKESSTGNALITNLPFTVASGSTWMCGSVFASVMTAGVGDTNLSATPLASSATIFIFKTTAGAGSVAILTDADFTNTSDLRFNFMYDI